MAQRPVFYPGLGKFFVGLREKKPGRSQRQMAQIAKTRGLDISYQLIQRLEKGTIKHPEAADLRAIAKLYGTTYTAVVGPVLEAVYGVRAKELAEITSRASSEGAAVPTVLSDEQRTWLAALDSLRELPETHQLVLQLAQNMRSPDPARRGGAASPHEPAVGGEGQGRENTGRTRRSQSG